MSDTTTLQVNSVQRFCLQDGPGIRSTVFLQGCTLRCWWCHNAAMRPTSPGGVARSLEDLVDEIERDARYWVRSGGGVTLSGGEPLCQPDGCARLLSMLGEHGHHRCVETAGTASGDMIAALDPFVDIWLFDLKTLDHAAFGDATGGNLAEVIANVRGLLQRRADSVWVRIPLIRDFNADEASLGEMRQFLARQPRPARLQLIPGHDLGESHPRNPAVDAETCRRAQDIFREAGDHVETCW